MTSPIEAGKRKRGRPSAQGCRHAKYLLRKMQVLHLFHGLRDAGEKYEQAVQATCLQMREQFDDVISAAEVYRILASAHDKTTGIELAVRPCTDAQGLPAYGLYFRERVTYLHPSTRVKNVVQPRR